MDNQNRLQQAKYLVSSGRFFEAGEMLKQVSPSEDSEQDSLPIRIKICTSTQQWDLGSVLVQRVTNWDTLEMREAAAQFLLTYLQFGGFNDAQGARIVERAQALWPEGIS